jgi:hypothetical protein
LHSNTGKPSGAQGMNGKYNNSTQQDFPGFFVLFCSFFHIINTNKFFQCLFFPLKRKDFASCLSQKVGEMQNKAFHFFVSDASLTNRTQTSKVNEYRFFKTFFNTDEPRIS